VQRLAYSVTEVSQALGVPVATVRGWIRSRELASLRIGRRVLVPAAELDRVAGVVPGPPAQPAPSREVRSILRRLGV